MFNNTKSFNKINSTLSFKLKNLTLLAIIKDQQIDPFILWLLSFKFSKTRRLKTITKIKKRCVLSGRSRSLYNFVRLSRLFLRENSLIGKIPGLRKAYW